jgi:biofilm PGA synthesis N-glycosyltransferase PgaC
MHSIFHILSFLREVELPDKISVFIPVFRESQLLKNMLNFLIKDSYENKEILVCIDEPSEKSIKLVNEYPQIKFLLSPQRQGKVNSLNDATKYANGKIFLFLDSDLILNQVDFLNKVYNEIATYDLLEIKKKIILDSFLAKSVHYDFLSGNLLNWYMAKNNGNFLWLNGSAFAICSHIFHKLGGFSKTVSEDFDIALKAYKQDLNFGYSEEAEVFLKVNPSWKAWYKQRQRWAVGVVQWFQQNWSDVTSNSWYSNLLTPLLINSIPLFLGVALFLMPNLVTEPLGQLLIVISLQKIVIIPKLIITSNIILVIQSLISSLLSFTFNFMILKYAAKKLGYIFKPIEFIFFYFIYNLILLFVNIISILKYIFWRKDIKLDWKV